MPERDVLSDLSEREYIAALNRDIMRERARAEDAESEIERLRGVMRGANRHGCRAMNKVRDRTAPNTAAQRSAAEELGRALDLLQAEIDSRRSSDDQGAPGA